MRQAIVPLMLILPILTFAACEAPEDEALLEASAQEAELQEAELQEAGLQETDDDEEFSPLSDLTSSQGTAWKCHCWTTCSSNGKGWTKSYFVGSYSTKARCDKHAKSFCKGKASDYKYANSGCGQHP